VPPCFVTAIKRGPIMASTVAGGRPSTAKVRTEFAQTARHFAPVASTCFLISRPMHFSSKLEAKGWMDSTWMVTICFIGPCSNATIASNQAFQTSPTSRRRVAETE
jgi:hypothetical protein